MLMVGWGRVDRVWVGLPTEDLDAGVGDAQGQHGCKQQFHGSASGDQGEDLASCIRSALAGELNGELLKVANLLGGHGRNTYGVW